MVELTAEFQKVFLGSYEPSWSWVYYANLIVFRMFASFLFFFRVEVEFNFLKGLVHRYFELPHS